MPSVIRRGSLPDAYRFGWLKEEAPEGFVIGQTRGEVAMLQSKIRMLAERLVTSIEESRRRAHRHNHDYLEFWRTQHGD